MPPPPRRGRKFGLRARTGTDSHQDGLKPYRQPPVQTLWLVESVSEVLNIGDNPVFDPDTLHQKVRTKVVRPKFNLNIRVDSRYPVDLRRVTAERADLNAARSPVDGPTSASHPGTRKRWQAPQRE